MLDKAAPQKVRYADRPHKPWFNNYIHKQKNIVKNRDQIYKINREEHHWRAYTIERNKYSGLLKYHKKQVITKQIMDNSKNTKELFKIVNEITGYCYDFGSFIYSK